MLKISASYLENIKVLFQKKDFSGRCQYQNKEALSTDPIFSEGFDKKVIQRKENSALEDFCQESTC